MAAPFSRGSDLKRPKTMREYFERKITVNQATGCWEWSGRSYSFAWFKGKKQYAHRASWELHRGPIPDGMYVATSATTLVALTRITCSSEHRGTTLLMPSAKGGCKRRDAGRDSSREIRAAPNSHQIRRRKLGPLPRGAKPLVSAPSLACQPKLPRKFFTAKHGSNCLRGGPRNRAGGVRLFCSCHSALPTRAANEGGGFLSQTGKFRAEYPQAPARCPSRFYSISCDGTVQRAGAHLWKGDTG
jgi:hypothetical protein